MKEVRPFSKYEHNVSSQFGEDGVIAEIFRRIGNGNRFCVEFGAWDGKHFSNTWDLWHNHGWRAVLIEGDPTKFAVLQTAIEAFPNVMSMNKYVTGSGENCLDKLLMTTDAPKQFDLLSVDIDSDDYYILEGLNAFEPRLLLIEYNPTVPPHIHLVQKEGEYFGASALALFELARKKNYHLVHMTETNMFFLSDIEIVKAGVPKFSLSDLFIPKHLMHVVTGYDGRTLVLGNNFYAHFVDEQTTTHFPEIAGPQDLRIQSVIIYNAVNKSRIALLGNYIKQKWANFLHKSRGRR
jgi:hypothetical protein